MSVQLSASYVIAGCTEKLSLQADDKVAFEDIRVFGVCCPACHGSSLYLVVLPWFFSLRLAVGPSVAKSTRSLQHLYQQMHDICCSSSRDPSQPMQCVYILWSRPQCGGRTISNHNVDMHDSSGSTAHPTQLCRVSYTTIIDRTLSRQPNPEIT